MLLHSILNFALVASAASGPACRSHVDNGDGCTDTKCYNRLACADTNGHPFADSCRAYLLATVSSCPIPTTKAVKGIVTTVTTTATEGLCSTVHAQKRGELLVSNSAATASQCTPSVQTPVKSVPSYATQACSPVDFELACGCLGFKSSTSTLPKSTITRTSTAYDSTVTKVVTTCNPLVCTDSTVTVVSSIRQTASAINTTIGTLTKTITETLTPVGISTAPAASVLITVYPTVTSTETKTVTSNSITASIYIPFPLPIDITASIGLLQAKPASFDRSIINIGGRESKQDKAKRVASSADCMHAMTTKFTTKTITPTITVKATATVTTTVTAESTFYTVSAPEATYTITGVPSTITETVTATLTSAVAVTVTGSTHVLLCDNAGQGSLGKGSAGGCSSNCFCDRAAQGTNFYCVDDAVPYVKCTSDVDCPTGQICDGLLGRCDSGVSCSSTFAGNQPAIDAAADIGVVSATSELEAFLMIGDSNTL